ncbi:hypothetical protein [Chitinophaga filiformis]|uniref:YD repeat-containing protein n=1 Tax=Chitinophaga filiformis TaxID=104663 RepID=A0ABY4HUI1_CHIFI|nr:hypothetical protein [Chitinophaga filiformis]UPK67446.1 hypothetical protein MYF79_21110 [Chitinophaga filiformis]
MAKTVGRYNNDFDNSTVTTYEYIYDDDSYPVTRKDSTQVIRGGLVCGAYHDSFRYRYMIRQAKPY